MKRTCPQWLGITYRRYKSVRMDVAIFVAFWSSAGPVPGGGVPPAGAVTRDQGGRGRCWHVAFEDPPLL